MNWLEMLGTIFEVCIIPLLGVLTTYLIKFINTKAKEIASKQDNELAVKYIQLLDNTITQCVLATNQTYVDSLKNQGKFDLEAQKKAFELTYNSVIAILTDEAKDYLSVAYGDLQIYINKKIEASVNAEKTLNAIAAE